MKILHLTLKKKWFDMVLSGVKKEEYRKIKPHWNSRLNKSFDAIEFKNGYQKDFPKFLIELKGIEKSLGIVEWGAPEWETVYILKLGKIINHNSTREDHKIENRVKKDGKKF